MNSSSKTIMKLVAQVARVESAARKQRKEMKILRRLVMEIVRKSSDLAVGEDTKKTSSESEDEERRAEGTKESGRGDEQEAGDEEGEDPVDCRNVPLPESEGEEEEAPAKKLLDPPTVFQCGDLREKSPAEQENAKRIAQEKRSSAMERRRREEWQTGKKRAQVNEDSDILTHISAGRLACLLYKKISQV